MAAGSVVLRDLAGRIRDVPFDAMLPAVKQIKQIAAAEGGRMAHVSKRGVKLRAVDRQVPGKAESVVVWRIQGVPVGPWVWTETGTAAHRIRRRKRGKLAKLTVAHPGSAGAGRWSKVADRAEPIVVATFTDQLDRLLAGW
jgi:hypothetical protein